MCSRWRLTFGVSFTLVACFDTQLVDDTRTVQVDDFEDRDQWADPDSGFGAWFCYAWYGDENVSQECPAGSPGFDSEAAGSLTFRLEPPDDLASTGVLLGVGSARAQSLRSLRSLRFAARLTELETRPEIATRLEVELVCPAAFAGLHDAAFPLITYYNPKNDKFGVKIADDWKVYSLPLTHFEEPWWQGSALDPMKCLEHVEALKFVIAPDVSSFEVVAGTLWIDDVYLE